MKTLAIVMSVVAVLALVAVAPARGQGKQLMGKPAPEVSASYWLYTPPLTLKALQGKIVVVEFWATWCPPCRQSIPHLITLSKKYGPQGVVFVSLSNEPQDKVEPFAKEMGMTYAVGGGSNTGAAYGVTGIPTAFLVDTAGTVVGVGHPMDPGFVAAIELQLKRTPPKIMSPQDKALAKVLLDKAEETIKSGELAVAAGALAKMPSLDDFVLRERAESVRKAMAEAVTARMAEADKLIEAKDYYKASRILTQIAGQGAGSPEAAKAQARLKELTDNEAARAAIEQGKREDQSAELLAELEKSGPSKSTAEMLAALDDLATRFADTKGGKAAADKAKSMRADPELMKKMTQASADKDCKGWLALARNFIKAGLKDKAKSYLDMVIQKYPDTDYAKEAKELLASFAKAPAGDK
jgi:thiol-disulfide isomerase/thioredoxin